MRPWYRAGWLGTGWQSFVRDCEIQCLRQLPFFGWGGGTVQARFESEPMEVLYSVTCHKIEQLKAEVHVFSDPVLCLGGEFPDEPRSPKSMDTGKNCVFRFNP